MTDLSHWHFAEHFSGYDAAALILGLEPRESQNEEWCIRVVAERMELHYERARTRFLWETHAPQEAWPDYEKAHHPIELTSVKMDELHRQCVQYGWNGTFKDWLNGLRQPIFENQSFSRTAIVNWLAAINMKSVYPFSRDLIDERTTAAIAGRWPWGNHHTEMLGHLEAAATRFWTKYDRADPQTASTNAIISEWLQTERKVSRSMADSIASMLRADGLPTGPRK